MKISGGSLAAELSSSPLLLDPHHATINWGNNHPKSLHQVRRNTFEAVLGSAI